MFSYLKKLFNIDSDRYVNHKEGIIISCFYNPKKSPHRLSAFYKYYETIKHLNHIIIECAIGDDEFQLRGVSNITRVRAKDPLWHKETLINKVVASLPSEYQYIFWVDADLIFTNKMWMVDAVNNLKSGNKIVQLFEYGIHLNEGETEPDFSLHEPKRYAHEPNMRHPQVWRSFGFNYVTRKDLSKSHNYDVHGHVGFAWGATRELLTKVPLYDKALIGGADHIIAHAAVGEIHHSCIVKSFTADIDDVDDWSNKFYKAAQGKLGYISGDVYHLWHGDLVNRQYLKRIQEFTPMVKSAVKKDDSGMYTTESALVLNYMTTYLDNRETVTPNNDFQGFDGGSSGGAGATGTWDAPTEPGTDEHKVESDNNINSPSENFS